MTESVLGTGAAAGADIPTEAVTDISPPKTVTVIGIGPRILAGIVDMVLVAILSFLVAMIGGLIGEFVGMYSANSNRWGAFFTAGAGLAFSIWYYISAWAKGGQTPGFMLLGLKVVSTTGAPVTVGKATLRYVGYLISALALSLGFVWIAFDKRRQGWHDKFGGTVVVHADRQSFEGEPNVVFTPSDGRAGRLVLVAWVVLLFTAKGALVAALLTLGPFVDIAISTLRGR